MGERKVRTPQGSVLANGEDRRRMVRPVRLRYGKCHRKYTALLVPVALERGGSRQGKGEKVRPPDGFGGSM
jgi:hypothetical protein